MRRRRADATRLVDLFDEARELVRRGADRAQRLLVVHAQRAEQADGAERLVREAVGRADEGEVVETGLLELVADAGERPARENDCASTSSNAARFSSASMRLR